MQWYHARVGALRDAVRATLEGNRVTRGDVRYTRPALKTYPHQWLWDSCFHAILWDLVGYRAMAQDELRALFRAQEHDGLDRGRVPHMTFHDDAGRDAELWGNPHASTITQPPLIAEAVLRVGDRALWRELWPALCAYYDWWLRRRMPGEDGHAFIWHPWECGADATPRADRAMLAIAQSGRTPRALAAQTDNPTARKRGDLLVARFLLLEDLQDIDAAEAAGSIDEATAQARRIGTYGHVAADMQAYLAKNLADLAAIGDALAEHAAASHYRAASARSAAALATLWDEATGAYLDRLGGDPVPVLTPATFVPLYVDAIEEPRARRLLAHLDDPRRFATRWPIPSVARDDAAFDADEYWRGSTWINTCWFACRGLALAEQRFGGGAWRTTARRIAAAAVELVSTLGLREYYRSDGETPAAFGPEQFGWSGLALDLERMLAEELS